jgi:hypothetical protein
MPSVYLCLQVSSVPLQKHQQDPGCQEHQQQQQHHNLPLGATVLALKRVQLLVFLPVLVGVLLLLLVLWPLFLLFLVLVLALQAGL